MYGCETAMNNGQIGEKVDRETAGKGGGWRNVVPSPIRLG